MSVTTRLARVDFDRLWPRRETLLYGSVLVSAELLVLALHAVFGASTPLGWLGLRYWLYPFVWLNVGLWAIYRTTPTDASTRHRRLAAVAAVGYLGVLAYTGGLVGHSHGAANGWGVVVGTVPPGWAPTLTYTGSVLSLTLIPYKVVGYVALAYLVYATIIDATSAALGGVLGVLSCVSCSWPVIASLLAGTVGSTSALAAFAYSSSYGLSTLVFVVTVGLLYWRPVGR